MENILENCGASVCEACGAEFTCGASLAGCWCTELKLTDEAQTRLREKYQQCLCRPCLEKYATAESLPAI